MIHRTEIFAVDIKSNVSDILSEIDDFKYSRIPVYDENIDDIKGILYTKDLIKFLKKQDIVTRKRIVNAISLLPAGDAKSPS